MPASLHAAIQFLETQWSSINDNKLKGILSELRFKQYLTQNNVHYVPGGWIVTPGKATLVNVPARYKVCILPRVHSFSWELNQNTQQAVLTPAEISAYNYFRQVGVKAVFAQPILINEQAYSLPLRSIGGVRASYPRPYQLQFMEVAPNGSLVQIALATVFQNFPVRNGNRGMRCYPSGRIGVTQAPWTDASVVSDLFWFEYCRYFVQVDYLLSNNDLDLFVIGLSGSAYPVEIKSKTTFNDPALGDCFGIDIGPFAKLTFFTANAMNTDALYVVEEVDAQQNHLDWFGIRFTDLVKSCSWVGQAGGTGMRGGSSSTYKIPKAAFLQMNNLIPTL